MIKKSLRLLLAIVLVLYCHGAWAQFTTIIYAPPTVIGDQQSIGSNTQLNVSAGGSVGDYFQAGAADGSSSNVEVNISGGTVGNDFTAYSGSTVNVSGGTVGDFNAGAFPDENADIEVNISGGTIGQVNSNYGSVVNMTGGFVSQVYDNELMNISGGRVGFLHVTVVSEASISGGTVERIECLQESVVNISGTAIVDFIYSLFGDSEVNISNGTVGFSMGGSEVNISGGMIDYQSGIYSGTVLNVSGGAIDFGFRARGHSTLNLMGGLIANDFLADNSTVNITGGSIGEDFGVVSGAVVNLTNGAIGVDAGISDSVVNISGGFVDRSLFINNGAQVNISGGAIGESAVVGTASTIFSGSEVNFSGGLIGRGLDVHQGNQVHLFGTQFVLGNVDLTPTLTPGVPMTISVRDLELTGLLVDGSPFSFDLLSSTTPGSGEFFSPNAVLTITLVTPGDFDFDGDVDGRDFLAWQRGSTPNPLSASDLADWQANYGAGGLGATTAVPEPSCLVLLIGLVLLRRDYVSRAAITAASAPACLLHPPQLRRSRTDWP